MALRTLSVTCSLRTTEAVELHALTDWQCGALRIDDYVACRFTELPQYQIKDSAFTMVGGVVASVGAGAGADAGIGADIGDNIGDGVVLLLVLPVNLCKLFLTLRACRMPAKL